MRLLIDTHCWLWYLLTPDKLNRDVQAVMSDAGHEIFFSAASVWEIVIKSALGKLELPAVASEYIPSRLATLGHQSLAIDQRHVLQVERLPAHHKDPFDRILVAQAQVEDLRIVTADPALTFYDVPVVWAGPAMPDSPAPDTRPGE